MFQRLFPYFLVMLLMAGLPAVAAPTAVWFTAADEVQVRGDLYALEIDEAKTAPLILLFHQAGSNRGEYAEIAPRLNALGFNALAIDQRSGDDRWDTVNETVGKLGGSKGYLAALPDLEAALKWSQAEGYRGKILVWGSSYSAALVFLLAAEHSEIDAILSFSPGEYLGSQSDEVKKAARKVSQPVLIMTPANERGRARAISEAVAGEDKTFFVPRQALHGASMLVSERNPGAEEIWPEVEKFLEKVR